MTTTCHEAPVARAPRVAALRPPMGRLVVGGFFLMMSGVHLGVVAVEPGTYRHFADAGLFAFVRDGWIEIVMAAPAVYGLLLMAGEATAGFLLLLGGRAARFGWAAVITFHVLLMLFGWWVWAWSVPALVMLTLLARHDLATSIDERPLP